MKKPNALIEPSVAKKLLKADLANIEKKVKNNKPLTKAERTLLQSTIEAGQATAEEFAKNQSVLADLLEVDRKTVQRWLKANPELKKSPYKKPNGRYHVPSWRKWKADKSGSPEDEGPTANQLKARHASLQAEKLEIQIGVLRKEYVRASDVEKWAGEMVIAAKKILLAMPSVLAPQLVGLTVVDAEQRLKEEINEALEQLHAQPWAE